MAIPEQITPRNLNDYLEVITRAVFQAGVSWKMVENKWDAFREDFADFDVHKVANFRASDINRLCEDARILRSRKKIEGTIYNTRALIEIENQYGSMQNYFDSFPDYKRLSADLKARLKFMGEMNVYYFLFRVRQAVPDFDEWIVTIQGHHPRMREMVEHSRKAGERFVS